MIFNKNYVPDKCFFQTTDSILTFDLIIQTPIQYQLFKAKNEDLQFVDSRFVTYILDKKSKSVSMTLRL